jgi:hypothetical protein
VVLKVAVVAVGIVVVQRVLRVVEDEAANVGVTVVVTDVLISRVVKVERVMVDRIVAVAVVRTDPPGLAEGPCKVTLVVEPAHSGQIVHLNLSNRQNLFLRKRLPVLFLFDPLVN